MADKQFLEQLARKLADGGNLIESGWIAFRAVFMREASANTLAVTRLAYMSGAQHLFASIMAMLEPGETETPADLARMDQINAELTVFAREMELLLKKSAGTG